MPARPRRRAVGPPGARPPQDEPRPSDEDRDARPRAPDGRDDERLRAERPPHHDQGV